MVSEMFAGAAECPQQPCCRFPKTRFVRYRRCSPPRIGCTTPSPKRSIVGSFASEICVPVGEVVQVIGETRHGEGSGLNVVYTLDPHQMGVEFIGEINERSKTEFLSEAGAFVPDRLAGAFRPGHDRGHGVRHTRPCFPPWSRFGNHRPRRHGRHR